MYIHISSSDSIGIMIQYLPHFRQRQYRNRGVIPIDVLGKTGKMIQYVPVCQARPIQEQGCKETHVSIEILQVKRWVVYKWLAYRLYTHHYKVELGQSIRPLRNILP